MTCRSEDTPIPTDATARGRVELPTFDRWHLDSLIREWCAGPVFPKVAPHLIDGLVHAVRVRLDRADRAALASGTGIGEEVPFQARVAPWVVTCFGDEAACDELERMDRFVEEALEAVQSRGYNSARIDALKAYVYGREPGETRQEIGGVMMTLAAWCNAIGQDMHEAGEAELTRVWGKVDVIQAKQAAKRILDRDVTLTLAQRLAKEEGDLTAALRRDDLMPGDIEGAFHRIRDALGTFAPASTMAEVERLIREMAGLARSTPWTASSGEIIALDASIVSVLDAVRRLLTPAEDIAALVNAYASACLAVGAAEVDPGGHLCREMDECRATLLATIASLREGREVGAELVALSEKATPGEATFEIVPQHCPECDDADLPGSLRIGGIEIAAVHEKYGPGVTPRYEADGALLAELWNQHRARIAAEDRAQIAATRPVQAGETGERS